jgi:hypothetical protein
MDQELEARLARASTNSDIAVAIAALATLAWRSGDEERLLRLEYWIALNNLWHWRLDEPKLIAIHPASLRVVDQLPAPFQKHLDAPVTARMCAALLVRPYVARGEPVEWLVRSPVSVDMPLFAAQVGGWLWFEGEWAREDAQPLTVGRRRVGVSRVGSLKSQRGVRSARPVP